MLMRFIRAGPVALPSVARRALTLMLNIDVKTPAILTPALSLPLLAYANPFGCCVLRI
jgi:hypothetical protein